MFGYACWHIHFCLYNLDNNKTHVFSFEVFILNYIALVILEIRKKNT
jgi:hypothetical protein